MLHPHALQWYSENVDIAVLKWPEQREERSSLQRAGRARLLLLDEATPPPASGNDCLEDWIRLPATDEDVQARLSGLRERQKHHPAVPTIGSYGEFSYRGADQILSPIEQAIAEVLVDRFGHLAHEQDLIDHGWPEGDGTATALRVHMHRLRKRIKTMGLTIHAIRGRGYVLTEERPQAPEGATRER
jgi:hypothetical protein